LSPSYFFSSNFFERNKLVIKYLKYTANADIVAFLRDDSGGGKYWWPWVKYVTGENIQFLVGNLCIIGAEGERCTKKVT